MKTNIVQNTTKTLDLDRNVLSTHVSECYRIEPDEGKVLKNTRTGEIIDGSVYTYRRSELSYFIEMEKPKLEVVKNNLE